MGRSAESLVTLEGQAPIVGKGGGAKGGGDGGVETEARGYNLETVARKKAAEGGLEASARGAESDARVLFGARPAPREVRLRRMGDILAWWRRPTAV